MEFPGLVTDDTYVCTLDPASVEKARRELNEEPADRLAAVKALRDWAEAQPHFKARTDTLFLLSILRTRKFSQLESRNMLEGIYKMRETVPEWFKNCDPGSPAVQAVIDTGFMIPLPDYDDEGRKVILSVRGNIDPDSKTYDPVRDVIQASAAASVLINTVEKNQVNGYVYLMDFSRMTMRHQNMMGMDKIRKLMKSWIGNFPGRFKAFHIYNAGSFLEFMMTVFKTMMPSKYSSRMFVHSNLESIYKHIPKRLLPIEYLPDEYTGQNGGTLRELTDQLKNVCLNEDFRQSVISGSSDKYWYDDSKKPLEIATSSFRKLNID